MWLWRCPTIDDVSTLKELGITHLLSFLVPHDRGYEQLPSKCFVTHRIELADDDGTDLGGALDEGISWIGPSIF